MTEMFSRLTETAKRHPVISFILSVLPIAGFSFGVANLYYQKTLAEYEQKVLFQNIEIMKLQRDIESLTRAPKRSVVGEKQPETNDREISAENLKEKVKLTGEKVVLLFDTDLKISPNH